MPRAFTDDEHARIRARLLEAGVAAIARSGLRRTAVEDLTRAAGISKGAFYRFFETKEALWIALLEQAEQDARRKMRVILDDPAPGRLRRVLEALFDDVWRDPVLRALADGEDLAWLARSLPPGVLEAAGADDDRFFGEVWRELQAAGDAAADVDPQVFAGLPAVALALAQQRARIGVDRADDVVALVVDGLVARLAGRPGG